MDIIDDDLFETPEEFFGLLSDDGNLPPNVRLEPATATATINDNERMCETS